MRPFLKTKPKLPECCTSQKQGLLPASFQPELGPGLSLSALQIPSSHHWAAEDVGIADSISGPSLESISQRELRAYLEPRPPVAY